jgi:hypothetical protein
MTRRIAGAGRAPPWPLAPRACHLNQRAHFAVQPGYYFIVGIVPVLTRIGGAWRLTGKANNELVTLLSMTTKRWSAAASTVSLTVPVTLRSGRTPRPGTVTRASTIRARLSLSDPPTAHSLATRWTNATTRRTLVSQPSGPPPCNLPQSYAHQASCADRYHQQGAGTISVPLGRGKNRSTELPSPPLARRGGIALDVLIHRKKNSRPPESPVARRSRGRPAQDPSAKSIRSDRRDRHLASARHSHGACITRPLGELQLSAVDVLEQGCTVHNLRMTIKSSGSPPKQLKIANAAKCGFWHSSG